MPNLRFSSSACTRDAALDKTSNGVSIPGWNLKGKKERERERNLNRIQKSFRILVLTIRMILPRNANHSSEDEILPILGRN